MSNRKKKNIQNIIQESLEILATNPLKSTLIFKFKLMNMQGMIPEIRH